MVQLGLGFSDGESLFHVVVNIYVLVYFGSVLFWSLVSDNMQYAIFCCCI